MKAGKWEGKQIIGRIAEMKERTQKASSQHRVAFPSEVYLQTERKWKLVSGERVNLILHFGSVSHTEKQ